MADRTVEDRWKNTKSALGDFRESLESSGKEKVANFIEASKNVLAEFSHNAFVKFSESKAKTEFAAASFIALESLGFTTLTLASFKGGLPNNIAIPGAVTFAGGALMLGALSKSLFTDWYQENYKA